jgi:EAL domain-containing protein (putative c-di-GMP-specific phosphodiesterase class I)
VELATAHQQDGGHGEVAGVIADIEKALSGFKLQLFAQRISPLGHAGRRPNLEVLLRLEGRQSQLLLPSEFLAIADRMHLAASIDTWVLEHALAAVAALPEADLGWISVNIGEPSLRQPGFGNNLRAMLRDLHADPRRLCIELSERAANAHLAQTVQLARDLRDSGVHLALDDFGSAVASYGLLKGLPLDSVKISGRHVRRLIDDPLDHLLVRGLREAAAICGLVTVAEHVENRQTLNLLQRIGFDFAQGFHVHRPEPIATVLNAHGPAQGGPTQDPSH